MNTNTNRSTLVLLLVLVFVLILVPLSHALDWVSTTSNDDFSPRILSVMMKTNTDGRRALFFEVESADLTLATFDIFYTVPEFKGGRPVLERNARKAKLECSAILIPKIACNDPCCKELRVRIGCRPQCPFSNYYLQIAVKVTNEIGLTSKRTCFEFPKMCDKQSTYGKLIEC
ncbi:MAG: hypothetical protein ACMG6E_10350 [Candidatus Roizmanbacteria bacterium]